MKIRSNDGMYVSVVLGLLLCAASGFAQTRPTPSETFQSPVTIEITTATGVTKGVGKVVFDQPSGKAHEIYHLRSSPRDEIITRYDLGEILRTDGHTCDVTDVTGTMPPTWDWVQNAKMGTGDVVDGIPITYWVTTEIVDPSPFSFGPGKLRLGATNDQSATPVVFDVITPERTVRLHFLHFRTMFRAKPGLFRLPRHCSLTPASTSSTSTTSSSSTSTSTSSTTSSTSTSTTSTTSPVCAYQCPPVDSVGDSLVNTGTLGGLPSCDYPTSTCVYSPSTGVLDSFLGNSCPANADLVCM
jgi:hypothetical protein